MWGCPEKYYYKIKWLNHLKKYLNAQLSREEPLCLLGDFNIALEERDIYNKARFNNGIMASQIERESLETILKKNN